jgi:type II secretory ATPase GspE/PulE/Tfp pilus assembly ATPase PilB-like protein
MPSVDVIFPGVGLLLAELPQEGGYFSPVRIILFLACVAIWAHSSAWVQKDTVRIRVPAGTWTWMVFGGGAACLALWLVAPVYWIGLGVYVAVFGSAILVYVFFRNGRVSPAETMLTPAHLQRMLRGKSTASAGFSKDKVHIKDADGKTPPWPTDAEHHGAFAALQDLLFDAIWRRASDVRIDLAPQQPLKIVYRVDGVDRLREPLDGEVGPLVFHYFKKVAGMNPEERRRPQNGHFKATIGAGGKGDKSVDVEAKTSGSTAGERFVLKIVSEEGKFRIADIGLTDKQVPVVRGMVAAPRGVVLVSGSKGSGITSSLYALLREHDAFLQNIHTLEISRDIDVENITQHVYDNQDGTITYGKRLRSILRTEPDVCMASDIPDAETAKVVAEAGKAGKKIYAGLVARDTFSALQKYIQAIENPAAAAAGLVGITSQRLLRVVCENCRKGYMPDPQILKKANLPTGENRPFYRPPNPEDMETDKHGHPIVCPVCQGAGYLGRTGVFELLVIDDVLRSMIAQGTPLATVKAQARKQGMLLLQEVALHKVFEGATSIAEVLRVTKEGQSAKAGARAS